MHCIRCWPVRWMFCVHWVRSITDKILNTTILEMKNYPNYMLVKNLPNYLSITLLLFAMACGNKNQQGMQGPPPVNVTVQPVTSGDAAYYDEYPTIIRALNEVELRAQVSGYITGIHFTEGEKVKKGQKLYS